MGKLYLTTQGVFRLAWRVPQPILRTLFISSLQYHSCPQALYALTAFGVALPYPSVPTGNSWAWGIQGCREMTNERARGDCPAWTSDRPRPERG